MSAPPRGEHLVDYRGGVVRIAIISDIHANLAALEALPLAGVDQIWCLGDLVGYGPRPREVIQWIRDNAMVVVRGNHDHAVGYNVEARCSQALSFLAANTRNYTMAAVSDEDRGLLTKLPVRRQFKLGEESFFCVHAIPSDPLFTYCAETSNQWQHEVDCITADVLLVGHAYTPFIRRLGRTLIVNPGSLGQPKTGRPFACYALYEDGKFELKEYDYPIEKTIDAIRGMPISSDDQEALISVLHTGASSPSAALEQNRVQSKKILAVGGREG
jgi:putative phosphoesterase